MTGPKPPRWEFGRRLIGWRSADRDVREEMATHQELRVRELLARGLDEPAARRQAAREVGDMDDVARRVSHVAASTDRRRGISQWLDEARQDVLTTWRTARRTPGFTALLVLTIAIGLGANAAIFGVVNVAVFTPLPFDPDNTLVRVREYRTAADGTMLPVDASRRTADAIADMRDVFRDSVPISGSGRTLTRDGNPIRVAGTRVGPGFTRVVGITPILGRTFTVEEEQAGEAGGALLISHGLWQRAFGGTPDVLGRTVHLDGRPFVVTGVLQPSFHIPYESDIWFPSQFGDSERNIFILARLAPGVTLEAARAALAPVAVELNRRFPDLQRSLGITAQQARDYFVDNEHQVALVLMAAVGVLLLIACTNVALLLTTRFASRQTEVAMRAALGCSRARQVRQFVTEGLALFTVGGALGVGLALLFKDALVVLLPEAIAGQVGIEGIPVDLRLVGFATLVSLVTGVGFGLVAALRTTRADLQAVMKGSGRSVAGASSRGLLGSLVVVEVVLAVSLVFSAGVMIDTFRRLRGQEMGFRTEDVVSVQVDLNSARYAPADARRSFVADVLEQVARRPAVEAVAATTVNPLCCGDWGIRVHPEGIDALTQAQAPILQHFIVTPGYFRALERPLLEGRDFQPSDAPGAEPVVIIDRAMANRFWPGTSAVGKRVRRWSTNGAYPWLTVVGVVESAREEGAYPEAWYMPHAQNADGPSANGVHIVARGQNVNAVTAAIRESVREQDASLAVYGVTTFEQLLGEILHQDRMGAWITSAFGAAGLLLAALGVYGVLTFVVAGDRIELAVRRALGASARDVVSLLVRRAALLVGLGLLAGAAAAAGIAQLLPRIFEAAQPDPTLIAWSAATLAVVSMLAIVAPIRRALRLDALEAMRR